MVHACSIGCSWAEKYESNVHKETHNTAIHGKSKVVLDEYDDEKMVKDRIHWLFYVVCNVCNVDAMF